MKWTWYGWLWYLLFQITFSGNQLRKRGWNLYFIICMRKLQVSNVLTKCWIEGERELDAGVTTMSVLKFPQILPCIGWVVHLIVYGANVSVSHSSNVVPQVEGYSPLTLLSKVNYRLCLCENRHWSVKTASPLYWLPAITSSMNRSCDMTGST